jgi:TetR/AcrR family transcriptional repressor of mexCD-oprJ operon
MPATRDRVRGQRADARRNIAAILDAALACLVRDPDASIGEIAAAAGVGRVTLYGHFPSRAELVDAVFARAVAEADEALDSVDLTGDPRQALARLVASSWQIVNRHRMLLRAAQHTLDPERLRDHHQRPLRRVERLIARGRREGAFRTDLPAAWLVATFYSVLHGAADEILAGRLADRDAGRTISATLLAAFTPPGQRVPDGTG